MSTAGELYWLDVPVFVPKAKFFNVLVEAIGCDFVLTLIELPNRANGARWWCDMTYLW